MAVLASILTLWVAGSAAPGSGAVGGRSRPEDCAVGVVKSNGLAARSAVIRFPGASAAPDFEITLIGHNHGSRAAASEIQTLLGQRGLSDARFSAGLARLSDRAADHDSSDDVAFLKKALSGPPATAAGHGASSIGAINFVGVEGTQAAVEANLRAYAAIRQSLSKEISRRKLMKQDDLLKSAFGAESYLLLTEPTLFQGRSLIGIENAQAADGFAKAQSSYDTSFTAMKSVRVSEESSRAFSKTEQDLASLYPTYSPSTDDEKILKAARATFSAAELRSIEPYLKARLKLMSAMKLRDQRDVEAILSRHSNGIVFVGSTHLASMTSLLAGLCHARLASAGAKSATASSAND